MGLSWRTSKGLTNTLELVQGFWFKENEEEKKEEIKVRQPKIPNNFGSFLPDSPPQHLGNWDHSSRTRHPSHYWQEHENPGRTRGMRLQLLPISSPFPSTGQVLLSPFHLQGFPWWALHILEFHWSLLDVPWSGCLIQSPWTSRQGGSLECSCGAARSSVSRVGAVCPARR